MQDANKALEDVIQEALRELLEYYGHGAASEVRAAPRAAPPRAAFAASLGFTAEVLRGTLVLIAPEDAVARVLPPELARGDISPDRLADWAAELSNQLVGRVKNKLLRYRIVVSLSVPTVFRAENLRCYPRKTSMPSGATTVQLTTKLAEFEAWFDVEMQADIDFSQRLSVAPAVDEGELVFL